MADPVTTLAGAIAIVVLLGLSAFFSSSESAIFTIAGSRWADEHAAATDDRSATLRELLADPHRLLVTILVGNNVVNIAISSLVTAGLVAVLPPGIAVIAATLLASAVILVFGEIVPKSYGLGNAERWALTVARPLTVVERVLSPVVLVFDGLTRRLTVQLGGDQRIEAPYLD